MDSNQFAPDNDCTGKMQKAKVVCSFLFETNQQFAEAVEKRMRNLYYPAPGFKTGIPQRQSFFICQDASLCPHFSPGRLDCGPLPPEPEVL